MIGFADLSCNISCTHITNILTTTRQVLLKGFERATKNEV